MKYTIRQASYEDSDELFKLWIKLLNSQKKYDSELYNHKNIDKDRILKSFNSSNGEITYIAKINNEIIGFIQFYKSLGDSIFGSENIYIKSFFINEMCRNPIIMSSLYYEAEKWASRNYINYINTDIYTMNKTVYLFLQKYANMNPLLTRAILKL